MQEILNFSMRFLFFLQIPSESDGPHLAALRGSGGCGGWTFPVGSGNCLLNIFLFLGFQPHDSLCRNIFPLDLARPVAPLPEYLRTY